MELRWRNGIFSVGQMPWRDAYGVQLSWGRRDLMGEDVKEGETWFADHVYLVMATGRECRKHGSAWRAMVARILGTR